MKLGTAVRTTKRPLSRPTNAPSAKAAPIPSSIGIWKCPEMIATIIDPPTIRKILTHLGVRGDPLPRARARYPTGQTDFGFDAA